VDDAPKPLEVVLSGEKQRELHRALLLLPQANRLALLMHVWGNYSYAEIAAFTEVRVTTVEGRIYRAKRQMQRLLYDEGTAFLTSRPDYPMSETTKERLHDKPTDER
jgi:DNA-directed RNA polymerase specialized sigma24 family protein